MRQGDKSTDADGWCSTNQDEPQEGFCLYFGGTCGWGREWFERLFATCRSGCTFLSLVQILMQVVCAELQTPFWKVKGLCGGAGFGRNLCQEKLYLCVAHRIPPLGIAELLTVEGEDSHCSSGGDSIS